MKRLLEIFTPRVLKLVLILLPFACAAIYYFGFAADRYVSESIITVRQANSDQTSIPGMALLLGVVNPPSRDDSLYLRQYIHSRDLLRILDERLHLRNHFSSQKVDPLFRLNDRASQEDFFDYYQNRVEILFDDTSYLLTVRTQAFDADFSQLINKTILEECERFVNAFSQRMAREQMAFAQKELDRATGLVESARDKVLEFQTRNKLLDPLAQAQASEALAATLQASIAKQEAELRALLAYLNPDSYQVKAQQAQLDAMRAQLSAERVRATAGTTDTRLNNLTAQFRELTQRATFAHDTYKLALTAVENSRIDAARKLKSLVVIDSPSRPQTPEYPRRIYNLVTLLVISLLAYLVARLIMATIRDHTD